MSEQRFEWRPDGVTAPERLPEIYAFNNGGSPGWYSMQALTEDGEFLAGHCCSSDHFGPHDMGVTSDWKHDHYRERYPNGFAVIWVPGKPSNDPRIKAAYAKHVAAGKAGTPWQQAQGRVGAAAEGEERP